MAASRQECSICMDSFKNPRLISCHHSFCYKCLEDYVRVNLCNGRFNCPICRTSVELPNKGVSAFQRNFYIETNEKFACDLCGPKSVACSRCLDCEENLCQSCCYAHEKSKASRHHKIRDLGTLDSEMKGKIRQRIFCDHHPEEEIKLVCQDCKVPICFMCKAIKHDIHPTKSVADVAAEVKKSLDTKLNQCQDKLKRIKASTAKGEELDRSINDAECQELKAVDDQCSQLHKVIDQEGAKMKDKIKSVYHLLRQQNAVFKRDIGDEFNLCSDTKDKTQKLRDQGTDMEIIKTGPNLEQAISAAILKTDQTPSTRLDNKLFSPAKINAGVLIPLIGIMQDSTDAEERKKKEREERVRKEREEREKKEREKREKKERDEVIFFQQEKKKKERVHNGGGNMLNKEERVRKEGEEREKKEREEREKKERNQMNVFGSYGGNMMMSGAPVENTLGTGNSMMRDVLLNQWGMFCSYRGDVMPGYSGVNNSGTTNPFQYNPQTQMEEREEMEREEREKKEREDGEKKERGTAGTFNTDDAVLQSYDRYPC